jgi:hypothetical protein
MLRARYGRKEDVCSDFCVTWCCACCAIAQEARELDAREGLGATPGAPLPQSMGDTAANVVAAPPPQPQWQPMVQM